QRELCDHGLDLRVDGPTAARENLALEGLHLAQQGGRRLCARPEPLVSGDTLDLLREAFPNEIANPLRRRVRELLAQPCDAQSSGNLDLSVIGSNLARDELQRRRFSRAVTTDQTNALAFVDREIGFDQDASIGERERNTIESNEWRHFFSL